MTPEQQEFYEKLGDALAEVTQQVTSGKKYINRNFLPIYEAAQKLHDLWPTLCELDEWLGCEYDSEVKMVIKCAHPFISKAVGCKERA